MSKEIPQEYTVESCSNSSIEKSTLISRIKTTFNKISERLDAMGVEQRGIQRIPPYERSSARKQFIAVSTFWWAAAGGLSSMESFVLGPLLFSLTFKQSVWCGLVSMGFGCVVAAYCSTMGPQSGCRQMVTARFLFGWYAVKFVALVAIIGVMGYSIVNCVVGGEMLAAISDGKVPLWVGIVIITVISFFVSIFGIKQVLRFETWLAVPVTITIMLLYIATSNKFHVLNEFSNEHLYDAMTYRGKILSFFSLCYSVTSTWGSITADYYVLFPESTPKYQVFTLTFLGTFIPTTFVGVASVILGCIANSDPHAMDMYNKYGFGGLLAAGFSRWGGFGKFLVVILLLSLISNNIINTYSAAFGLQLSSVHMSKIPRWFWAILCTAFYVTCALVGRNSFATILGNFLPMVGYWISIYFAILLEENLIFRKMFRGLYIKEFELTEEEKQSIHRFAKHDYNWSAWNDHTRLTNGYAAIVAFAFGAVGAVLGMNQTYYVGVLAKKIGEDGGDVAMWMCLVFPALVYPPLRILELRKYNK